MDSWYNLSTLDSKNYICGHCGRDITSNLGYFLHDEEYCRNRPCGRGYIYICHKCNKPTYVSYAEQVPGAMFGENFDEEIFEDETTYKLYEETRKCMKVGAYTSVGMCCRKLLMHIAVDCGAEEGNTFAHYVDYLDSNNYIPTKCKKWVDIIRNKGNEANHEICLLTKEDAMQLIQFIQILVTVIYEMPHQVDEYVGEPNE